MTFSFKPLLAVICLSVTACSYPEYADWPFDGHQTPDNPADNSVISIALLKSRYQGYPYTFVENVFIRGWVVSSDRSGNYYKTLAITDDTAAVEIKLDADELFKTYPVGSVVEVACNGLTLGAYGGALQLGVVSDSGYETDYIPAQNIARTIRVIGILEQAPVPVRLTIATVDDSYVGRLVSFDDVQFVEAVDGTTWCDSKPENLSAYIDTYRTIIDRNGNTLIVRTSRYAEFASWTLPYGSGRIEGILSCFGGHFQLKVISPEILYDDMSGPRFTVE